MPETIYDRSQVRKDESKYKDHPFAICKCGAQVHYIDTVKMENIGSECFVLFWYDFEEGNLQVAQHMGVSLEGLERLAELMGSILEGSMNLLRRGE